MKTTTIKTVLSLATATMILTGCGGGGASGGTTPDLETTIEVERGKVYDSNVTDSAGLVAIQKAGTNLYTFTGNITYPIKAVGGWIDLNDDGARTVLDMPLDINLTAYDGAKTLTPATTYLSDNNASVRAIKLQELLIALGTTEENLLKVPSKGTAETVIANNAIFKDMKISNSTALNIADINATIQDFKTRITTFVSANQADLAKQFENDMITNSAGVIKKYTAQQISIINAGTGGTPAENTNNTTYADYSTIYIYKNMSSMVKTVLSRTPPAHSTVLNNANTLTCLGFGYTESDRVTNHVSDVRGAKRYMKNNFSCVESDFSAISYSSGNESFAYGTSL